MNTASRRKEGTLSNFKVILARTSVNGNVKSRYKAHEDFLMLAGEAYITHAALNHFGMVNLTDQPTKNCPPSDIGKIHYQKRLNIFNEIMDDFLKKILSPFSFEEVIICCLFFTHNLRGPSGRADSGLLNVAQPLTAMGSNPARAIRIPHGLQWFYTCAL